MPRRVSGDGRRPGMLSRVLLVLGAVAPLLACGLPQPFRHTAYAPDSNPLVSLRSGAGVHVLPVVDAPLPMDRMIAIDLADWLRSREIPAVAVIDPPTKPVGLTLVGWLREAVDERTERPEAPAMLRLTVQWTLVASDGTVLEETLHTTRVPARAWTDLDPRAATLMVRDSGRAVAALVVPDQSLTVATRRPVAGSGRAGPQASGAGEGARAAPTESPEGAPAGQENATVAAEAAAPAAPASAASSPPREPARSVTALVMAPPEVTRAPGDGKPALERAVAQLFRMNGVRIAEAPSDDRLRVRGAVEVLPGDRSGEEAVSIVWELLDADGASLGQVNQANTIPKGSLDGAWGDTAALIAEGAVMGIGEILVRKGLVASPGK
ncbi:hypothetical protein F1188_01235 [Roseospira marina]|uniref:Uncharacterized protein n=1 Tax=Roseospira marina TaxID=140057 RepID=A0A5M6IIK6_9PROT|nr:hypothetical protein [Roseospira marina]KAA5607418.1 hypothetical protein F1188_01235 [Roseospira marina]MBB4312407.1 hypothetical protein [Roseospira marina]MBB5085577.1 hypothetical protein [Roseospira marina]